MWFTLIPTYLNFAIDWFLFLSNFYARKMFFELARNTFIHTIIIKVKNYSNIVIIVIARVNFEKYKSHIFLNFDLKKNLKELLMGPSFDESLQKWPTFLYIWQRCEPWGFCEKWKKLPHLQAGPSMMWFFYACCRCSMRSSLPG